MAKVFFPGCRIKSGYPEASDKLREYIFEKFGIEPTGCCKENFNKLGKSDTAVLICNNCANYLRELNENSNFEFVWKIIDSDKDFIFPDYSGLRVTVQDCRSGYGEALSNVEQIVRSLLVKMNIEYTDMPADRAIPYGMEYNEHSLMVTANSELCQTEDVLCYCAICNLKMRNAGKKSHYLLDLIFGIDKIQK